jgi:hypothetical protein
MDFFSEKELVTQTGHEIAEWPLVFLKETVDNALDACEEADTAPEIHVTADNGGITVRDNGPGLPEETLRGALNYTVRTSSREAYVAPDRGAQGNALKTILPMAVVVDAEHGKLTIEAHGKRHVITCRADSVSQRAVINDDVEELRTEGTTIGIAWARREDADGDAIWPFSVLLPTYDGNFAERFRHLLEGFALFNPHATFRLNWFGAETTWSATNVDWKKWKPHQPTSIHWYELSHLKRLIGAYITHDRDSGEDRLVSEFVAQFDGLSGSQKRSRVLEAADLHRVRLSELVVDGQLDNPRISQLLAFMQQHTRPVSSKRLGILGEEHLRERLLAMGIVPNSFKYSRKLSKEGLPCVIESAFGWKGEDAEDKRRIFAGANWSAAIHNPFRTFGGTDEGLEAVLTDLKVGAREPIVFVLHLAHPCIEYTDRGKSALVLREGNQA